MKKSCYFCGSRKVKKFGKTIGSIRGCRGKKETVIFSGIVTIKTTHISNTKRTLYPLF
jgi:hypothetical protein